ncbi:TULIP family P47-like protein [Litorivita sp. NS0012-18]|uniref:TULIP family P47-like protein n=1 Tax=Litorivita sp. NS0012-18 TaxID=3127655 RepID=UPI0031052B26
MNLLGWDTIYVSDIVEINTELGDYTASIKQSLNASESGASIQAELGRWQIVRGGSGKYVRIAIEITQGTLKLSDTSVQLSGCKVLLNIKLSLLPAPTGGGQQLVFDFEAAGKPDAAATVTPVSPNGIISPKASLTPFQEAMLGMEVAKTLVANAGKVAFVLAHIEPFGSSGISWLEPKKCAFSYGEEVGTNRQLLAIFAVTNNRSITGLPTNLSTGLLASDCNAGMAISETLFLKNVFAPAYAKSLHTSVANLAVSGPRDFFDFDQHERGFDKEFLETLDTLVGTDWGANAQDTLHTKHHIDLHHIKVGLITYDPVIDGASAVVSDDVISTALHGHCSLKLGINMTFHSSSVMTATFDAKSQSVKFHVKGKPAFAKKVHVPPLLNWAKLIDLIAGLIFDAVVAAIGSALSDAINRVTSSKKISEHAIAAVTWGGKGTFKPIRGGLASAFYIQGNY